jgi:hypothetical protein
MGLIGCLVSNQKHPRYRVNGMSGPPGTVKKKNHNGLRKPSIDIIERRVHILSHNSFAVPKKNKTFRGGQQVSIAQEQDAEVIYNKRDLINRNLTECIDRLSQEVSWDFIKVKLDIQRQNTRAKLNTILSDDSRIFIDISSNPVVLRSSRNCKRNQSHLVEISFSKKPTENGWFSAKSPACAHAICSLNEVYALMIDIALDISVFHSLPLLKDSYDTNARRQILSCEKVQFARDRQLNASHLGIRDTKVGFITFASFARRSSDPLDVDFRRYFEFWEEFIKDRVLVEYKHIIDVVRYICTVHKKGGQLSQRRLYSLIEGLEDGLYVLIRSSKKPGTEKKKQTLLAMLEKTKWRSGHIKIVSYKDVNPFLRYWPHVECFTFPVRGGHAKNTRVRDLFELH